MLAIEAAIREADELDRLIQLCDSICLPQGVCLMEKRLMDVAMRHGTPACGLNKWRAYFRIKAEFESRLGYSVYELFPEASAVTFGFSRTRG